jgi:deoxycytidylate deaminase
MADLKTEKYDAAYLRMAAEWSKLSHCKRRQVGALIVKGRSIISDGYNGTPSGFENFCEDEEGYTSGMCCTQKRTRYSKWPQPPNPAKEQPSILPCHPARNAAS